MRDNTASSRQNFRPIHGRKGVSRSATLTTDEVTSWCATTLRTIYGTDAKKLAREAGSNTDAARNWLQGKNALSLTYFLRIAEARPELLAHIRQITRMNEEGDPRLEAAMVNLVQTYLRTRQRELETGGDGGNP